jgi:hypothetical protein
MPTNKEILKLATRLASKELITLRLLPRRKFWDFCAWANAILIKLVPPPAWLAEIDPGFRDPEIQKPFKNPNRLSVAECRKIRHSRFSCKIRLTTPLPCYGRLPKPDKPPTRERIESFAVSLDRDELKKELMYFPQWKKYFDNDPREQKQKALREAQAERILMGKEAPPDWLVRKAPHMWIPEQKIQTHPAPSCVEAATAHLRRTRFPLMAAWIILAVADPPPPPEEDSLPAAPPPQREPERTLRLLPVTKEILLCEIHLFDNQIAV